MYPANDRTAYFLKDMRSFLSATLRPFSNLRVLQLAASFQGLLLGGGAPAARSLALFEALAAVPVEAGLHQLESVRFEIPAGNGEYEVLFREGVRRVLVAGLLRGREGEMKGGRWLEGLGPPLRGSAAKEESRFRKLGRCDVKFVREGSEAWVIRRVL